MQILGFPWCAGASMLPAGVRSLRRQPGPGFRTCRGLRLLSIDGPGEGCGSVVSGTLVADPAAGAAVRAVRRRGRRPAGVAGRFLRTMPRRGTRDGRAAPRPPGRTDDDLRRGGRSASIPRALRGDHGAVALRWGRCAGTHLVEIAHAGDRPVRRPARWRAAAPPRSTAADSPSGRGSRRGWAPRRSRRGRVVDRGANADRKTSWPPTRRGFPGRIRLPACCPAGIPTTCCGVIRRAPVPEAAAGPSC